MTQYKTLNPTGHIVMCGPWPIAGLSKGEALTIAFDEDAVKVITDASGNGRFVESEIKSGTIELKLPSMNPGNAILTTFCMAKQSFPFLHKNGTGLSLFESPSVRIKKMPPLAASDDEVDVTWEMIFITGKMVHGGALPA
jgi:hypothetical protein